MNHQYNDTLERLHRETAGSAPVRCFEAGPLEVNVVFSDPEATAAALRFAQGLARDLGARIHLRASIVVPMQLPLDRPAVSVPFMEGLLRQLVSQLEPETFEPRADLYICRDWPKMLAQMLAPNSLVIVGGRKRWWPNRASRMAAALRTAGHRVIFVDARGRPTGMFLVKRSTLGYKIAAR